MNTMQPDQLVRILGAPFVRQLNDHDDGAALRIGSDVWSKHEIATDLGIVHTKACSLLSTVAKKLKVRNTADLFEQTSPYTFAEYPVGVTTLYVMFSAFLAKGLDPQAWYRQGQEHAIVTFLSLKERERVAERRTRDDQKRRVRASRHKSHQTRVDRFLRSSA